jgi:hypothetical protein
VDLILSSMQMPELELENVSDLMRKIIRLGLGLAWCGGTGNRLRLCVVGGLDAH